jgi:hypothetical protein
VTGQLTRRRFLGLAAAGVGVTGTWRFLGMAAGDDAGSPAERLTAVLGERGPGREVGTRYLDGHPAEADEQLLLRRLAGLGDPAAVSTEQLRERARRVVRSEFEEGRTVIVDGWYLSVTEARLCALSTYV